MIARFLLLVGFALAIAVTWWRLLRSVIKHRNKGSMADGEPADYPPGFP